jgi:hypothetical protein
MESVNYVVQKDSWFSPIEIINHFEKLRSYYKDLSNPVFKKAHEMFSAAVALLGAYELSEENKYFLQVNTQSATPDVMAGKQTEQGKKGILLEMCQMEITEFEEHSKTDDIIEFLQSTKLPPKRDYGKNTMIVCIVNKKIPLDQKKLIDAMKVLKPNSSVYILGRPIGASAGTFNIMSPCPKPTKLVEFNVNETAAKYWLPERADFNFELQEKIEYIPKEAKPLNTYEILGLDRDRIYKKLGIKEVLK